MDKSKEIISKELKTIQEGSPMYKYSRKMQRVRNSLSHWCREYKTANNVIWDDIMDKCSRIQGEIESEASMKQDWKVREESFDQTLIKLAYWKQEQRVNG